ncbi:sensor histidine kinase [Actinomadura pelletieri]|uniref:sensor histidine kinase n=1 Tax=Actinomadura pelletieri TaxID=111805 RepID=UPI000EB55DD1|nr:histidine kinase [Actinomadura pelletieri]
MRLAKTVLPGLLLVLLALVENTLWGRAGVGPWQLAGTAVPAGVAVCLRHRVPTAALFGVATVIVVLSLTTPSGETTPILLCYLLALALMAYHAGYTGVTRQVPWRLPVILAGMMLAGSAGTAVLAHAGADAWMFGAAIVVIFGLVPALLGRDRSRQRQLVRAGWNQVAQLEREQRIIAQETRLRERARIAQDMHDSLGHELSLIALRVGGLEVSPDFDERHRTVFGELRWAVMAATERLAEIVGVLGDDSEPEAGDPVHGDVRELVDRARDSGMEIDLRVDGEEHRPPLMVERAAFRVLQEALTNAAKHAPGAPVTVAVDHSATETVVTVRNERPAGAARPACGSGGQRGLIGLRERSRLLGGTLEAGERGGVYEVRARLPHAKNRGAPHIEPHAEPYVETRAAEEPNGG